MGIKVSTGFCLVLNPASLCGSGSWGWAWSEDRAAPPPHCPEEVPFPQGTTLPKPMARYSFELPYHLLTFLDIAASFRRHVSKYFTFKFLVMLFWAPCLGILFDSASPLT